MKQSFMDLLKKRFPVEKKKEVKEEKKIVMVDSDV